MAEQRNVGFNIGKTVWSVDGTDLISIYMDVLSVVLMAHTEALIRCEIFSKSEEDR